MKYECHFPNQHQKHYHISKAQPNTFLLSTLANALSNSSKYERFFRPTGKKIPWFMAPRCSPFARPFCIAQEDGNSLQFYYNFQSSMQVLNFLGRRMYNLLESPIVTLFKGKTFNSFPTLHLFQRNSKTERPRPEGSRERSFFFLILIFSLVFSILGFYFALKNELLEAFQPLWIISHFRCNKKASLVVMWFLLFILQSGLECEARWCSLMEQIRSYFR